MSHFADLKTFDGLDNRREVIILLERLGTDERRSRFLEKLVPWSKLGFASSPVTVHGQCDAVAAYFVLLSICNELGVSINRAMIELEAEVKRIE